MKRWAWFVADSDDNGFVDKAELFLFIRNYEKYKSDREGLAALIRSFAEKSVNGSFKLGRRTLPKLLRVSSIC